MLLTAVAALGYDAAYRVATSENFWLPYWQRQLGPMTIATPIEGASTLAGHFAFYVSRVLWHPAPWSFALVIAAWRWRAGLMQAWRALPEPMGRGLLFALVFAGLQILMLTPSSRFAERYAFSASYVVAAAGVVAATRSWPTLAVWIRRADERVPALPAVIWLALMLLRLGPGALLPRV